MFTQKILLVICCCFTLIASATQAGTKNCSQLSARLRSNFEDPAKCQCRMSGFSNRLPEGGRSDIWPIAICGYHLYDGGNRGRYYFNLKIVISGKIRFKLPTETDSLYFDVDDNFQEFLPRTDGTVRFFDTSKAEGIFKPPHNAKMYGCWEAPASIHISRIHVNSLNGQDDDGIYAEEFKLIKLGKYNPCTNR